jgi:hypothetical protein
MLDCAGPIDTSHCLSSSLQLSFCRTIGRACALVAERARIPTMRCDVEDQAERRLMGFSTGRTIEI